MQSPGSKRFTASELTAYVESCKFCRKGWISVAIKPHTDWETYCFPCQCTYPGGGFVPDQLLDLSMYRNRTPEAVGEPEFHVLIHPAYMGHYMRPVRDIMMAYRQRLEAQAQAEAEGLPF